MDYIETWNGYKEIYSAPYWGIWKQQYLNLAATSRNSNQKLIAKLYVE